MRSTVHTTKFQSPRLLILTALIAIIRAQRPTYAGSRPIVGLADRFQDPNATTTTVSVVNRLGEDGTTPKLPVEANGDAGLVDRLNSWPRETRPFWLLNADHIDAHRGLNRTGGQNGTGTAAETRRGGREFMRNRNAISRSYDNANFSGRV